MFASLVTLDGFHLLLSTQLTANLTLERSGGSMFHPLSHIYTKTPFCCIETVANKTLNRWLGVVFDQLWANAAPTLNTAFSLTNVHAKWWIHCLLISSTPLLSHTTSIYDWPKRVCGIFQDNCKIWATWTFSIICVCPTTFKVSIPSPEQSPNNTYQAIALLEQYFSPSESNTLSTHKIQIFSLFWKLATVASLKYLEPIEWCVSKNTHKWSCIVLQGKN